MPRVLVDVTPQDAAKIEQANRRGEAIRIETGTPSAPGELRWPTIEEAEAMALRLEGARARWTEKFVAAEELIWACCKGAAATAKGRESVVSAYADVAARAARAYGNARLEQDGNWETVLADFDLLNAIGATAGIRVSRAAVAEASYSALLRPRGRSRNPGTDNPVHPEQMADLNRAVEVTQATRVGNLPLYRVRIVVHDKPSVVLVNASRMVELGTALRRGNNADRAVEIWLKAVIKAAYVRTPNPSSSTGGRHNLGTALSTETTHHNGLVQTAYAYDRATIVESYPAQGGPVQVDEYF